MAATAPLIVAFYSDAPRAGKSTAAKVLQHCAGEAGLPVDILSFAFPIRRACRQLLPASWPEDKVREHLSGSLKDAPIGELGGRSGRDLMKIIGNTVRARVRDDLWADRLMAEIDALPAPPGLVIVDDLRWPGEFFKLKERDAIIMRLVTAHPHENVGTVNEPVDGLLKGFEFTAELPAKGLVTQGVLEMLVRENTWPGLVKPELARRELLSDA